jgi:alpha-galactosidase
MSSLIESHAEHFHLKAGGASYVLQIVQGKYLAHAHWGAPLRAWHGANAPRFVDRAFSANPAGSPDRTFSLDTLRQEYPGFGRTDFRSPAFEAQLDDGSTTVDLLYRGYAVASGKPVLAGLPATFVTDTGAAETLEVFLKDELSGLAVTLCYTVFRDYPVVARSVRFTNQGSRPATLRRVLSFSLDFEGNGYRWLQLSGAHVREREVVERPLQPGTVSVESRRGASSHQQNPFVALLGPTADEDHGEVYGFNLVYSGNFLSQAEVDQFGVTRVQSGINPFDFAWKLEPGESFQSPEGLLAYSATGLGGLSRTFHRFFLEHLCRGPHVRKERPILINNWEATYFGFDQKKLEAIVEKAQPLGIELFVLDDGWFGHRDDDKTSLGDWVVDRRKLPGGLDALADTVHARGMQFGLWFEPEMVSADSDLFRAHPDWCLHVEGRSPSTSRDQLVLDLSRPEVCRWVTDAVLGILDGGKIDYVKWDMNRHLTEVGSVGRAADRQRETAHRHILGLYSMLEEITRRHPEILFESCSGGGGRFDPGMLFYMPQVWTSDNTDAICRLAIQWGTSLAYPPVTMGAHVSAVPNHQVHRFTPLSTRSDVALTGTFGYELDPLTFSSAEAQAVLETNNWYKAHRSILQFGDFYRIKSPHEGDWASWMSVTADKTKAVLFYFQILARPNAGQIVLKAKGLDRNLTYTVESPLLSGRWGGDELMGVGLRLPELRGDFQSLRLSLYS